MKRWLILLLVCTAAFAQDLKRPTVDDSGVLPSTLGCSGVASASTSMPLSYDAAGLSTSSNQQTLAVYKSNKAKSRRFLTWPAAAGVYTSLTLNINAFSLGAFAVSSGGGDGSACIGYSLNAGVSWTNLVCDSGAGWPQQTFSVTLSPTQSLPDIQVGVCAGGVAVGGFGEQGGDNVQVYDIWTVGDNGSAPVVGNGSSSGSPHRGVVIAN